jgi:hypothetical protein
MSDSIPEPLAKFNKFAQLVLANFAAIHKLPIFVCERPGRSIPETTYYQFCVRLAFEAAEEAVEDGFDVLTAFAAHWR